MKKLIVGISGASGALYGIRLLEMLRDLPVESHLVMSRAARRTIAEETDFSIDYVRALADTYYPPDDIGAAIASGSFRTMGMIIAPCSVKTMGEIANSIAGNLMSRAADVTLKERRKLVLMLRETPLHLGHLRQMTAVTEAGGIIMPPVPAFYARPETLDEMVTHTVGRALDVVGLDHDLIQRWGGEDDGD